MNSSIKYKKQNKRYFIRNKLSRNLVEKKNTMIEKIINNLFFMFDLFVEIGKQFLYIFWLKFVVFFMQIEFLMEFGF